MKNYKLQFETKTIKIKIKIKIRLAEKELTYLTPIQSENDFNLNSKTFEYSVGILSIVIIFYVRILLVQQTLYLLKFLTEKNGGGI